MAALLSLPVFAAGALSGKECVKTRNSKVELTTEQASTAQPAVFTGVAVIDDASLPGVTVVLHDEANGRDVSLVTDSNGVFTFLSVADGKYCVDLELAGFKPASIRHLELHSGAVTHARVAMRMADLETITVGGAALSPLEQSTISTTFMQTFIDKLP